MNETPGASSRRPARERIALVDRRSLVRSPWLWLGFLVSAAFAYYAVRDIRLSDTWAAIESSDVWWLVPGTATLAVAIAMRAIRWRALFDPASRPSIGASTRAMLIGYLFNNILPLRAGEAARVVALHAVARTSRAEALSSVVIERVYDVASLLALLVVALWWLPTLEWAPTAITFAVALATVLVAAVVVLVRWNRHVVRLAVALVSRVPRLTRERGEEIVSSGLRGLVGLTQARIAAVALAWTFASWLVMAISFGLIMRCFDFRVSASAALLVVIATSLSLVLPAAPASIGVFEAAVLIALKPYGVDPAQALSFALVLHAVLFFPFVAAGLLALSSARDAVAPGPRPPAASRESGARSRTG